MKELVVAILYKKYNYLLLIMFLLDTTYQKIKYFLKFIII